MAGVDGGDLDVTKLPETDASVKLRDEGILDAKEPLEADVELRNEADDSHHATLPKRTHKSTLKGLQYKLGTFQREMKRMSKCMKNQVGIMSSLFLIPNQPSTRDAIDTLNSETINLDKVYTELCDLYARAGVVIADDELAQSSEKYVALTIQMDEADATYYATKEAACRWLLQQKKMEQPLSSHNVDNNSVQSQDLDNRSELSRRNVSKWLLRQDDEQSIHSRKSVQSRNTSVHSGKSIKSRRSMQSNVSSVHSARSYQSSKSGKSNRSQGSVQSKVSDMSILQRAKVEGLKAEAQAIKETCEAEMKAKLLRVQQKIKKAEAIEKVLNNETDVGVKSRDDADGGHETMPKRTHKSSANALHNEFDIPNPKSTAMKSSDNKNNTITGDKAMKSPDNNLQAAVMEMMKLQCAPKPDMDTFSGDPLDYFYFKAAFKEIVEATVSDQRGRLTRLIKFTEGNPKELIKHLVHSNSKDCYDKAISLLDAEYGNTHIVSCRYIKELRQWPLVKQNDASSLKQLYRFLLKCQAYKSSTRLRELDSTDMLQTVISKVHGSHQDRWNRRAAEVRRRKSREADFHDLVRFVEKEAALLSDPAYSRDALQDAAKAFKSNSTQSLEKQVTFVKCTLCDGEHDIEDCEEFLKKDLNERHKVIFRSKLCFSCLEPITDDHLAKTCKNKRKCRVCSAQHPTTLHGGKGAAAYCSTIEDSVISMCVVPVQLWHKDKEGERMTVYALLDDCSQGTFICEEVLEKLKVPDQRYTSISVKTLHGEHEDQAIAANGLVVECTPTHANWYPKSQIELPCTYTRPFIAVDPEEIPTPPKIRAWNHLQKIAEKIPDYDPAIPIGLMIGANCPSALEPLEVISSSSSNGPYARRSRLGWCVIGPISVNRFQESLKCNTIRLAIPVRDASSGNIANHCFMITDSVKDNQVTKMLKEMYETDFNETASERRGLSVEDRKFITIMEKGSRKVNSHHEIPLPFRMEDVQLPNNRQQAMQRLNSLKRKLQRDTKFCEEYTKFMEATIAKGHARKADVSCDQPGNVWYAPHFGVTNKMKGKLRVVLDFSVKFKGRCLNEELLQGPDMTNMLVGVLIRFRKEPVAFMGDIEGMFHQVRIPDTQCSFLRFLWWPNGDLSQEAVDHEMCVHPFGATSSGGCSNYALRKTANDGEASFGIEAATTLRRNFYMDDMLKSTEGVDEAKSIIMQTRHMCAEGGFNLTKFVSNSREVVDSVPVDSRLPSLVNLDMGKLPVERALGVFWCVENDCFKFRIEMKDRPLTRRGILGTISSIYDPLGLAGPFILRGRKIMQQITIENSSWDDNVSPELRSAWEKWRKDLPDLQKLSINRCYKPKDFKTVKTSLHSFSDACDYGYGQSTYLRQVSDQGDVHVCLVMGKSRVVPNVKNRRTTIPRLELTAAFVSAKVAAMVKEELDIDQLDEVYWSDSMIALGYITNEVKRFRTFVANKVAKIHALTNRSQWNHVKTQHNPADDASRGMSVDDAAKVHRWFHGPQMLWETDEPWESSIIRTIIDDEDPEVHNTIVTYSTTTEWPDILAVLEARVSNWMRQKRILARVLVFLDRCRNLRPRDGDSFTVEDIRYAEIRMFRMIQEKYFPKDLDIIKSGKRKALSAQLSHLNPVLDGWNGLLKVGGRLRNSALEDQVKHPIILPKKCIVIRRVIEWHHRRIEHLGRTSTLSELRQHGYFLINANSQVCSVISMCVKCKKFRGQPATQKMADLPENRTVSDTPPFSYCGVDMFGPFIIKDGRKEVKRYGIIFTCFSSRAIHLETTVSADTDSFILALRRFIGRRGPVRTIHSDNGGNFVGAEAELQKAYEEMDHEKIKSFLQERSCDWIDWKRNPPESSHMGGVWERQIRSARNILASLLTEHGTRLSDESFRTLLVEVEAIVNSRPLTVESVNDETVKPLSPNHLLTMKSKVVLPPPGVFQAADIYCKRAWRRVQHLANTFWARWRKQYLVILQDRKKWKTAYPNFAVGDIVLVKEPDVTRNRWPMGRLVEIFPSDDGLIRKVKVKLANSESPLLRPVTKLVILVKSVKE